jgi:hypothetical protein
MKICCLAFCLFSLSVAIAQQSSTIIDQKLFKLDKRIRQHNAVFQSWIGKTDSLRKMVIIERVAKRKHAIIFKDFVRDGEYSLTDANNDGYKDFITYYHGYDQVHFFNKQTDAFSPNYLSFPDKNELLDSSKNLYIGLYREAMYGTPYPYSILYSFKDTLPQLHYKLVFETSETYSSMDDTQHLKLYRFKNNDFTETIFIKEIKVANPRKFDYIAYWKKNYKELLGY